MKKVTFLAVFLMGTVSLSAQDQERITDANASNYKSWSVGINAGPSLSLGDAYSFDQNKGDNVPGEIGGFELGVRGHITKFFNPTIGVTGSAGYGSLSGSNYDYWYEGDFIDGDISIVFNLSNWVMRGKVYDRRSAILFSTGIGITSMAATNMNGASIGSDGADRAIQTTIPLQLHYKYRLSESFDIDALYKHTFMSEDWPDVLYDGATADMLGYIGVGLSFNFGEADQKHVVYTNPLDDMYGSIESIREDYDKLTGDDDNDGVANYYDKDNSTPEDVAVSGSGEAMDSDGDGIPDYLDEDPFTRKGAQVDEQGRAVDSDEDGVPDAFDEEANTPEGALVNRQGKEVNVGSGSITAASLPAVFFGFNSANVTAANHYRLASVAQALKSNPNLNVRLVGYADKRGPEQYNKRLAERRAEEVAKQLTQVYGISEGRITTESNGENDPLANNRHDVNRRVDVIPAGN